MPKLFHLANIKLFKVHCEHCGQFLGHGIEDLAFKCPRCQKFTVAQTKSKQSKQSKQIKQIKITLPSGLKNET